MSATDLCLGFFDVCYEQGWMDIPPAACILEVGCAEVDWMTPMLQRHSDVQVTGIDWRPAHRPGRCLEADVLTVIFPAHAFDAIVSISTIEHIGLGAYEKRIGRKVSRDPIDPDGDTHALQRMAGWLRPGGWLYVDVPYRPTGPYTATSKFRAYDPEQLDGRLVAPTGLSIRHQQVFTSSHPDGPYIALVWEKAT